MPHAFSDRYISDICPPQTCRASVYVCMYVCMYVYTCVCYILTSETYVLHKRVAHPLYVCMYVCMYTCRASVYVCMHVYLYICVCLRLLHLRQMSTTNVSRICVCMYAYVLRICVCMYVYVLRICVCMYASIYVCVCVCLLDRYTSNICPPQVCRASVYVCMHVCMYVYVCMYTYVCIYMYDLVRCVYV